MNGQGKRLGQRGSDEEDESGKEKEERAGRNDDGGSVAGHGLVVVEGRGVERSALSVFCGACGGKSIS